MTAGYLVDANLLSATAPGRHPSPEKEAARAWIRANEARLFLPVTAVAEIAAGIGAREASGATRHARDLAAWLALLLDTWPDRVLAFDARAALQARALAARARAVGAAPGFADLSIACIARANDLAVATRNLRDFLPLGVEAIDPFRA
ncbi:PIN domain-containing protein [Paracraurococcus lichenis]|uniref:Ribonuclease VapC n=1 Tax=Paracraurococcus lichenis TaxID=3064888 RepID=A0ABT9E6Z0_9PROT|nr:PIN domain-containing protein [Paracraurococcus sp. LOR1-02]MDO9711955.1 VapC toxin family PIN domain ribonuclease [Paracraurococcus sp. LOR1-02]